MSGIINSAGSRSGVIGTTELDYEEGSWTPKMYIAGAEETSPTVTGGQYCRMGGLLFLAFYWYKTAVSNTGAMTLGNLPFALNDVSNPTSAYQHLSGGYGYFDNQACNNLSRWQVLNAGSQLLLRGYSDAATHIGDHGVTGNIEFSATGFLNLTRST